MSLNNSKSWQVPIVIATAITGIGLILTGIIGENYKDSSINKKEKLGYSALHGQIFNLGGFADTNIDDSKGYVSLSEEADACIRMGYEGPFFESDGRFCVPNLEELEKAIKSYQSE